MRKRISIGLVALGLMAVIGSCSRSSAGFDVADHREEVLDWRAGRLERLVAPTGYLTLAGLFWLDPGSHSFGSDTANDVVFPSNAAASLGNFNVSAEGVEMVVSDGAEVTVLEVLVDTIAMAADVTGEPVVAAHGTLEWMAIERDRKFAIRLRDLEHPARAAFGVLPYYEIDPTLRVTAKLKRYDEPRVANVGTVVEGLGYNPESPGVVEFEIDGERHQLEAYESGEYLFYVFGDVTNRGETYGAGRFLYSEQTDDKDELILDFNKAYSPPCAFNDFATCPVATPRNRLPIRIAAGEKYDASLHYAGSH